MSKPMCTGTRIAACVLVVGFFLIGCAATPGRERAWGYVVSTAYSPDGATIAAVTSESEVALFDTVPLRFRQSLTGEADKVPITRGVADQIGAAFRILPLRFSCDGTLLASSSASGQVTVWVASTGEARWRLPVGGMVSDLAWSPDGRTLLTTGPSATLWSMDNGARLADLLLPPAATATAAGLSPDGRQMVVGLSTGEIAVFDLASRATLQTLRAHTAPVSGLAFRPDGVVLASTAGGYDLRLWKSNPDKTFEASDAAASAASAQAEVDRAQGAGLLLWLFGTVRGFQIAGAPTLGAPPIVAGAQSQLARAARATPFHCGSRVAFSADGRTLASSANLLACADCIGTLAPGFLLFVTDLQAGTSTTVRDLGCDVALSPDGRTFTTAGPGAPQLRSSATGRQLPSAP